jgi:ATP adenylyltransferase
MQYIESARNPDPDTCLFCDKLEAGDDRAALILARAGAAFAILNAFPYNPGHLMVGPIRHEGELEDLTPEEMADSSALQQTAVRALRRASSPDGFNVGLNLGRVAGAGVPGHLHWHVVPRWDGDTNFMPVIAETKVLPELLDETYRKLEPLFRASKPIHPAECTGPDHPRNSFRTRPRERASGVHGTEVSGCRGKSGLPSSNAEHGARRTNLGDGHIRARDIFGPERPPRGGSRSERPCSCAPRLMARTPAPAQPG